MNKLITLLSALAVLPAYANEYAPPAAAAQPATTTQPVAQPKAAATTPASSAAMATPGNKSPDQQPRAASTAKVARAQFTNAVQDREPVDKVSSLLNDKNRIYFFSEIKDAPNQKITHRWEHDGKVVSETSFDVGGNRWRVFSNKTLDPKQTGEWKVSVLDETGSTLGASTFTYEDVAKAPAPSQPAAPAAAQPAAAPQKP